MQPLLLLIILTLIPTLELRASIPYGILGTDLDPIIVLLVAIIANILLGLVLYALLGTVVEWLRTWKNFDALFTRIVERPRRRIKKAIDRWGELGVALFIGVPLPGSGVYTAALGAYLLGVSKKDFAIATLIGVAIAAALVTIITLTGNGLFSWTIIGNAP